MKKILLFICFSILMLVTSCQGENKENENDTIKKAIDLYINNQLDLNFDLKSEYSLYEISGVIALKNKGYEFDLPELPENHFENFFAETLYHPAIHYYTVARLAELYEVEEPISKKYFSEFLSLKSLASNPLLSIIEMKKWQTLEEEEIVKKVKDSVNNSFNAGLGMMALYGIKDVNYHFINSILHEYTSVNGWNDEKEDTLPSSIPLAQLLMGVIAIGEKPRKYELYDKNYDLVSLLLQYQTANGQFNHRINSTSRNDEASAMSFAALCSYYTYLDTNTAFCIL